jgi:hypothetical protein
VHLEDSPWELGKSRRDRRGLKFLA